MNRILIAITVFVLWSVGAFFAGVEWRDRSADIQDLRTANAGLAAQVAEVNRTLETERQKARQLAAVAAKYEKEKSDAQARADALADQLRTGTRRLRGEIGALYTAQLSGAAAHSAELAAAVERGARAVAAAVGVGAACDARDRAWRALAEADREH